MKKRLFALLLCVCMMFGLVACTDEQTGNDNESGNETAEAAIETDKIKILKYKGLEVTLEESVLEITEADIDASIASTLELYAADNVDDVAENGDVVIIDYVGKMDGEAFSGGTASDQSITIGAGGYIDGFEDGIIGHKVGETFDVPVTFPENYTAELAGKDAVFTMTVKGIVPDLTDDLVKQISLTSETVEEFRAEQRAALEVSNEQTKVYELQSRIWDALIQQCRVDEYPQDMVEEQYAFLESMFSNLLDMYSLDDLCSSYFGIEADTYVANVIKQTLAADAIAEKEGLVVTEEDYEAMLKEYADAYGYTDPAEFEEQVGKETLDRNFINRKVADFLVENCIQVTE